MIVRLDLGIYSMDLLGRQRKLLNTALKYAKAVTGLEKIPKPARNVDVL
jgi:hypothetical protein